MVRYLCLFPSKPDLFMCICSYNSFIDLNQFTVATEIFPTHVRNQASAMAISGLFLADILWLNLLPTAMATIGWKYYLVFVCLAVAHSIYLMLYLPEVRASFEGKQYPYE